MPYLLKARGVKSMHTWMPGLVDGWYDGWYDGLMDGWIDGWMEYLYLERKQLLGLLS